MVHSEVRAALLSSCYDAHHADIYALCRLAIRSGLGGIIWVTPDEQCVVSDGDCGVTIYYWEECKIVNHNFQSIAVLLIYLMRVM